MAKQDLGPGYHKADDLIFGGKYNEVTYTISEVIAPNTIHSPDGKLIEHPMLVFAESGKRFVVGKTNRKLLKAETGGGKGSEFIGKRITIYPVVGNWFGRKNETSQRIRVTDGKPKPHIASKDLGTDITGRVICTTAAPADQASGEPSLEEQQRIQAAERQA